MGYTPMPKPPKKYGWSSMFSNVAKSISDVLSRPHTSISSALSTKIQYSSSNSLSAEIHNEVNKMMDDAKAMVDSVKTELGNMPAYISSSSGWGKMSIHVSAPLEIGTLVQLNHVENVQSSTGVTKIWGRVASCTDVSTSSKKEYLVELTSVMQEEAESPAATILDNFPVPPVSSSSSQMAALFPTAMPSPPPAAHARPTAPSKTVAPAPPAVDSIPARVRKRVII